MNEMESDVIACQLMRIGAAHRLNEFPIVAQSAEVEMNRTIDRLVVAIRAFVMAEKHEARSASVTRYATWHDHFRADVLPNWFNDRFPPNTITTVIFEPKEIRVCPHVDMPSKDPSHMYYLGRLDEHR